MNSKHHDKCKFALNLTQSSTISNLDLYPLKVVQNANFVNFVYYGKTQLRFVAEQLDESKTKLQTN